MSVKNSLKSKKLRREANKKHAELMLSLGNFTRVVWIKIKNKYGHFIYKPSKT